MRLTSASRVAISLLLALATQSACSFLIPEDESTPRYNDVLGERRMPQENPSSMRGADANRTQQSVPIAPVVQRTPMVQQQEEVQAMDLPPVDPATAREAQARLNNGRMVPVENAEYPILTDVPPRPDTDASARLARTRTELEGDRAIAVKDADRLRRDAAAEPSMLNDRGAMPAPMPVSVSPMSDNQPVAVPFPDAVATAPAGSIASLPPPPPAYAMTAPAPTPTYSAPTYTAAPVSEPIVLRAPAPAAAAPTFVATPAPQAMAPQPMAPAINGGFDPMAGGASASSNATPYSRASNGYLPSSRYTYRR